MNLTTIFLWAIQIAFVVGRTKEDVYFDFIPKFTEIHDTLASYEVNVHENGTKFINQVHDTIATSRGNGGYYIRTQTITLSHQMNEIIRKFNLSSHPELTQHCTDDASKKIAVVQEKFYFASDMTTQLNNRYLNTSIGLLNDLTTSLENEHSTLESFKSICMNCSTVYKVQNCFIENLYLKYDKYVSAIGLRTEEVLDNIFNINSKIRSNVQSCYLIIYQKIDPDFSTIVNWFETCIANIIRY